MSKKTISILSAAIGAAILVSACAVAVTPRETIQAPKAPVVEANNIGENEDSKVIVQRFIPTGYKLLETNKIINEKNIYELDLDNDKTNEIVAFIKNDEKFEKGFIVLKKKDNNWTKVYEKITEASSISMAEMVNVYNKDDNSLLVGFFISSHAGSIYNAYTLKKGKVDELQLGMYKRFEILNTPGKDKDNRFAYAAWIDYMANIQVCSILMFNGKNFFPADGLYSDDYNKKVIKYYQDIMKKNESIDYGKAQFVWQQLIEAQIGARKYEEALSSIIKVLDIKNSDNQILPVEEYEFNYLKGKALNGLGRYSKSEEVLNKAKDTVLNFLESKKDQYRTDEYNFKLSDIYLELGINYAAQNRKTEAKEMLAKSLSIIEGLVNKNYLLEDKNIYLYPIEREIEKLK